MIQESIVEQPVSIFQVLKTQRGLSLMILVWASILLAPTGMGKSLLFLMTFIGVFVAFYIEDYWLPIILILSLALGSSYRLDIASAGFYARFAILGIIAFRGFKTMIRYEPLTQKNGKKRNEGLFQVLFLAAGFFALYTGLQSVDTELSFKRGISFVLLVYVLAIYFWKRIETIQDVENFTLAALGAFFMIILAGWLMLIVGKGGLYYGGRLRLIVANPNQLGHLCAMFSPLAIWFSLENRHKVSTKVTLCLAGLLVGSIAGSASRGAMFAASIGLFLLLVRCYPKKLIQFLFLGVLVAIPAFVIKEKPLNPGEENSHVEEAYFRTNTLNTGSGRTGVWKAAFRLIDKKPLLGYGFASTDQLFKKGYFPELPLDFQGGHIHNGYIEELVNQGWLGSMPLFLVILGIHMIGLIYLFKPRMQPPSTFRLGCALYVFFLIGSIAAVFESWLTSVGSVFCFPYWFFGMLFLRHIRAEQSVSPSL